MNNEGKTIFSPSFNAFPKLTQNQQ